MEWKNCPFWLKGGIIGVIVYLILLLILFVFFGDIDPNTCDDSCLVPALWIALPGIFISAILFRFFSSAPYFNLPFSGIFIASLIAYFLIGAIIGLIVKKIRKKK